jgi:acyl-CoA dehydrogenase
MAGKEVHQICTMTSSGWVLCDYKPLMLQPREMRLYKTAPVNNNLVLADTGQHVLGMPRSY